MEACRLFFRVVGVDEVRIRVNFDFCIFVGIAETDGSITGVPGGGYATGTPGSGRSRNAKDGEAGAENKGHAENFGEAFFDLHDKNPFVKNRIENVMDCSVIKCRFVEDNRGSHKRNRKLFLPS